MIILGELIAVITNSSVKVSFIKITDGESSFPTVSCCRNSCQENTSSFLGPCETVTQVGSHRL